MKEPILEPLLRYARVKKVLKIIDKYKKKSLLKDIYLLDIGCGYKIELLKVVSSKIKIGYGIDYKPIDKNKYKKYNNIIIKTQKIKDKLDFKDNYFNIVTMLAVLEHLENPEEILLEIRRILKKDGILVLTVPSKYAKPILEFLSYKLKLIKESEIKEHKRYYNKKDLIEILNKTGFKIETHKYFQFYMNNFCIAKVIK